MVFAGEAFAGEAFAGEAFAGEAFAEEALVVALDDPAEHDPEGEWAVAVELDE